MIKQTFIDNTKFFFTDFHKGSVNILLHIISVAVFTYGLLSTSLLLAILGIAVIDELGHVYNFFIIHKRSQKYNPIRMLPYQILYVMPPAIILFKIFNLF